jgi:hypothetical protein
MRCDHVLGPFLDLSYFLCFSLLFLFSNFALVMPFHIIDIVKSLALRNLAGTLLELALHLEEMYHFFSVKSQAPFPEKLKVESLNQILLIFCSLEILSFLSLGRCIA